MHPAFEEEGTTKWGFFMSKHICILCVPRRSASGTTSDFSTVSRTDRSTTGGSADDARERSRPAAIEGDVEEEEEEEEDDEEWWREAAAELERASSPARPDFRFDRAAMMPDAAFMLVRDAVVAGADEDSAAAGGAAADTWSDGSLIDVRPDRRRPLVDRPVDAPPPGAGALSAPDRLPSSLADSLAFLPTILASISLSLVSSAISYSSCHCR